MFQEEGTIEHIVHVMSETESIAEDFGCTFTEKHLSENGKKFEVLGEDEDILIQVQESLRQQGLPEGFLFKGN